MSLIQLGQIMTWCFIQRVIFYCRAPHLDKIMFQFQCISAVKQFQEKMYSHSSSYLLPDSIHFQGWMSKGVDKFCKKYFGLVRSSIGYTDIGDWISKGDCLVKFKDLIHWSGITSVTDHVLYHSNQIQLNDLMLGPISNKIKCRLE